MSPERALLKELGKQEWLLELRLWFTMQVRVQIQRYFYFPFNLFVHFKDRKGFLSHSQQRHSIHNNEEKIGAQDKNRP